MRIEWNAYDVRWNDIDIEVKASAYVQRWAQRGSSVLQFQGFLGKLLDPATGKYAEEATYNADVYVLAAHLAPDHDGYRQFDITQWSFAVIRRSVLAATGQRSMVWSRAKQIAYSVVPFDGLAEAIQEAGTAEKALLID